MVRVPDPRRVADAIDGLVDAARADPLPVAIVALAVALVLLGAYVALRTRSPGHRFRRVLADCDEVAVLMHPNPDPDAMACALGVARLAEAGGTPATIQYPGQIRHQENRAFRTVLDLSFEEIDAARELAADAVVLVDHNEPRGFDGAGEVTPHAVVDHHPGDGTGAAFTDVRPTYGACASVVAEYLDELGARPGRDGAGGVSLDSELATGLLYGILADTRHLTRGCSAADFHASFYLHPAVDGDTLDRIAHPQIDSAVLDTKARAISDRDVRAPFAVCDVGPVSNVDAIPQAADELLRLEGVSAVVVFGVREGDFHLSGRSRDDRVHMGDALAAAVDDVPAASAGGHARMGAGRVPAAEARGEEEVHDGDGERVRADGDGARSAERLTAAALTERLFEAMRGER